MQHINLWDLFNVVDAGERLSKAMHSKPAIWDIDNETLENAEILEEKI